MSNSVSKSIEFINNELLESEKRLKDLNKLVIDLSKNASTIGKEFSTFKTPSQANEGLKKTKDLTEQITVLYKQQDLAEKKLINTRAKQELATESTNRANIKYSLELQQQNKLIKEASVLSSKLSTELEKASVVRNKLARTVQDLNLKRKLGQDLTVKEQELLKNSTKEFIKYDKAIKGAKESVNRYFESVGKYPNSMGKASASNSRFTKTLTHSNAVMKGAIGSARSLASSMGLVGGAFLIGGVIRDAFTRIRDFDKSMQNLAGILRTNRKDLTDLENTIISVAGSSVRTSNEIADLAQSLITLGKSKEDVKQLLSPVTDLSLALDASAEDAGEFLVQMLNSFGGSTAEAREYADTIATIRTSTSLDFQKMRDSFQYLAPISKVLNKDLAYTGALVGILADNGIKAERAGRLLGTAQQKLAKEGKSLNDALEEVNKASKDGKSELELLALASDLFGKQASTLGVILANNSDIIEINSQKIRDNKGALDDLVNEQLKSLDASLKILSSRWEEYLLKQNNATDGSNKLQKAITYLSDNLETIINTIITVVKWVGIYKGIMIASSIATSIATTATTAYRLALIAMRGGISKAILALKALKVATASSGIGLLIVALGSAYELFQSFAKGARDATTAQLSLNEAMKAGSDFVSGYLESKKKLLSNDLDEIKERERNALSLAKTEAEKKSIRLRFLKEQLSVINKYRKKELEEIKTREKDRDRVLKSGDKLGASYITGDIERRKKYMSFLDRQKNELIRIQREINKSTGSASTISFYEKLINSLKKERKETASNSKQYADYTEKIDNARIALARLEFKLKGIRLTAKGGQDAVKNLFNEFDVETNLKDTLNEQDEELQKNIKGFNDYRESIKKTGETLDNFAQNELGNLISGLEDVAGVKTGALDTFFEQIKNKGEKTFQEIADLAQSSFDIIGGAGNILFENNIERYDSEIDKNNEYYASLLENDRLSSEDKDRLQKDRDAKNKEIEKKKQKEQQKAFLFNQALAVAEIGINLAKTLSAINLAAAAIDAVTLGIGGSVYRAKNLPIAIATAGVQTALVLAKSIPKFKEGHLSGTHEGLAMINDAKGSNYKEVVQRKDGTLQMYQGRDQYIHMNKGDLVHKAGTFFDGISDKELLQNVEKYSILATIQNQNRIAQRAENNKLINSNRLDTDKIVKAIKSNKPSFKITNTTKIPSTAFINSMNQDF